MASSLKPGKRRVTVDIDSDLIDWYHRSYNSSLSWILDVLLTKFKEQHKETTPADLAQKGAAEVKKLIDEGVEVE